MIEKYWRVVRSFGEVEFIAGVQIDPLDTPKIVNRIGHILSIVNTKHEENPIHYDYHNSAMIIMTEIQRLWPDRYFFIEVGNENDFWVQIHYPETKFRKNYDASV